MMDESSLERLIEITEEALRDAYEKVVGLGEKGKEESGDVNELGDVTFRADMVAGKAVFDSLRRKNLNIRIVSEESRKRVKIGNANQFLGVIDEIDGSRPYKKGIGRYATMFAIFDGLSPFYNDYLVSGILDYLNKQIYLAAKAKGAYILE